jgi:hypothetical protein
LLGEIVKYRKPQITGAMSRNHKIEVQVIDDKLLIEGIINSRVMTEAEAARGGADINLVETAPTILNLSLSFKKIGKIENLVGFDTLTKLCLDNNLITKIVNLHHLVNLKWLDLSFNKIERIEGMDFLTHLEDLSLYSNRISVIEGLEQCKNLQCLSLGHNKIESLEEVKKLRKIRSLRMLTLADNPVCSESEYKMTVLAYIDTIKYLDYALVDVEDRNQAKEQCQDELIDEEEKEGVTQQSLDADKLLNARLDELEEAGIRFAYALFDDMFNEDGEIGKLKHLPGVRELVEQFRGAFKVKSDEYIGAALEKYGEKKGEINDFERAVNTIRGKDDSESTQLIDSFIHSKRAVVALVTDMLNPISQSERHRLVRKLQDELEKVPVVCSLLDCGLLFLFWNKVCDELMGIELRLVEKFETLVDKFEDRLSEIKAIALDAQQGFFREVEGLEDGFSRALGLLAQDIIEKMARDEIADDYLDEEGLALVSEKDTCLSVISASHDIHINRILKREDEARGTETKRFQEIVGSHKMAERTRNRNRVLEIHEFSTVSQGSLNALLYDDEDGFEEDEPAVAAAAHK